MQAWEQHLGGSTGQEKFYSCSGRSVREEEVTTIDDINNVVTIRVAPHTNSNDELRRNNRTINAAHNASNNHPN